MAAYIDYEYYVSTYLGTAIASSDFSRLALRASEMIDRMTNQRAAVVVAADVDAATIALIQSATCAVAEAWQTMERSGGADGIQSEGIGSSSVTYAKNSAMLLSNESRMQKAAKIFLDSTGLLYRGFYSGEYGGIVDSE